MLCHFQVSQCSDTSRELAEFSCWCITWWTISKCYKRPRSGDKPFFFTAIVHRLVQGLKLGVLQNLSRGGEIGFAAQLCCSVHLSYIMFAELYIFIMFQRFAAFLAPLTSGRVTIAANAIYVSKVYPMLKAGCCTVVLMLSNTSVKVTGNSYHGFLSPYFSD